MLVVVGEGVSGGFGESVMRVSGIEKKKNVLEPGEIISNSLLVLRGSL